MTHITIPPEALEAGARALYDLRVGGDPAITWEDATPGVKNPCRNRARAAFTAMVSAWPGMRENDGMGQEQFITSYALILPLQESRNDRE